MWLAMQQLLAGFSAAQRGAQATECVAEEFPVPIEQRRSPLSVADLAQRSGDSVGEVRCLQIDLAQGGMMPHQRVGITGRRDLCSHRFVVGPQRDGKGSTR